jgi:hypothetical protein
MGMAYSTRRNYEKYIQNGQKHKRMRLFWRQTAGTTILKLILKKLCVRCVLDSFALRSVPVVISCEDRNEHRGVS